MFELKETHQSTSFISPHLCLTNDLRIGFVVNQENAYIYEYDGNNFALSENITDTYKLSAWNYIHLAEGHQFMSIAGGNGNFVKIYSNNGSEFVPLTNNGTVDYPLYYAVYSSFDKSLDYFGVTFDQGSTCIYRNTTQDNMTLESTVAGKYYHRFSDDSKYLVTALYGEARVYFNPEKCAFNNCVLCNDSQCFECSTNFFISNSAC